MSFHDRWNPLYMYTQILKEILLSIQFEEKHFNEFIDFCHYTLVENPVFYILYSIALYD